MKLQKLFRNLMTLSLVTVGSIASADWQAPGNDYERGRGPGRGRDYCETREGFNDPRCRRDDRGDRWGRGPGRHPGRGPGYPGRGPGHGPGPGHGGPGYPPPYTPPPVYNPPPPRQAESSIIFGAVSRRGGGEWLRVNLLNPVRIQYISLIPIRAAAAVHETVVITRSGARYPVADLYNTGILYGQRTSRFLGINDPIVAVDIRAESMGGNADLQVTLVGDYSTPVQGVRF